MCGGVCLAPRWQSAWLDCVLSCLTKAREGTARYMRLYAPFTPSTLPPTSPCKLHSPFQPHPLSQFAPSPIPNPGKLLSFLTCSPSAAPAYFSVQANPELMKEELTALGDHLRAHAKAQGLPLTSLMVQHHSGVCNAAPDTAPIMPFPGQPTDAATTIQDTLCDLRFRISPTAFFQVNSPTTCLLYKMVADWAAPGPNTLLLDVCCGTGTIGLTMARRVQRVVGIDSVASAVADAAANAELNGITNAEYVCGRAEDLMESLLAQHVGGKAGEEVEVVAVVDPPRMGLHRNVLRALLRCSALKRLVFVACNPENAAGNIVALCSPPQPGGRRCWSLGRSRAVGWRRMLLKLDSASATGCCVCLSGLHVTPPPPCHLPCPIGACTLAPSSLPSPCPPSLTPSMSPPPCLVVQSKPAAAGAGGVEGAGPGAAPPPPTPGSPSPPSGLRRVTCSPTPTMWRRWCCWRGSDCVGWLEGLVGTALVGGGACVGSGKGLGDGWVGIAACCVFAWILQPRSLQCWVYCLWYQSRHRQKRCFKEQRPCDESPGLPGRTGVTFTAMFPTFRTSVQLFINEHAMSLMRHSAHRLNTTGVRVNSCQQ